MLPVTEKVIENAEKVLILSTKLWKIRKKVVIYA
jgi:hypothetical protein